MRDKIMELLVKNKVSLGDDEMDRAEAVTTHALDSTARVLSAGDVCS